MQTIKAKVKSVKVKLYVKCVSKAKLKRPSSGMAGGIDRA